jgi:hypothetical protein
MKKILLVLCLSLVTVKIFAQQFSQYNTNTLYDSFENPSQKAFVTDTSKKFAFNFLIPNFDANLLLTGNTQATLKSRAFLNAYNNSALQINESKYNHTNVNANVYLGMLKMFASLDGDEEIGISAQVRAEGKGLLSDESIALFNGAGSFNGGQLYSNIFNSNYYYQTYDQISFSYREKFNNKFAFGIKLSALSGVQYQKLEVTGSNAAFDKGNDLADVGLSGVYHSSYVPGSIDSRDYLPIFRNPGASVSLGTSYKTNDNFFLQANIKDLGFIHWSSRSTVYNFNNIAVIRGLSTPAREDSVYNKISDIVHNNGTVGSFTTPTDGRVELSAMKSFWIDGDNHTLKYSPTLIASKELFYNGFTAALVNPFQYQDYIITLTTSYDELKIFNLGLQFMYKTPNVEFFIGTDRLMQTASLAQDAISKSASGINTPSSSTGADIFLGFSLKFGEVIEHPMNASTIPTGEKGFLGRLFARLFKTDN